DDEQDFDDPALCLLHGIVVRGMVPSTSRAVQILPNPTNEAATLVYSLDEVETGMLVVYDALGKEVQRHSLSGAAHCYYFSTSGLRAGPYHYVFVSSSGSRAEGSLLIVR
ncbi:MAG: T9SS type A sorting domain-containing protein, partial [Flavobacteriales bacterium]|nr:T9SS type A sorting domain-containing protein [Flavobacteriales bacterium]